MEDVMNTRNSSVVDALLAGCGGLNAALGSLAAASVIAELDPIVPTVLAVSIALVGAMQAGLNGYVQRRTVRVDDVLEAKVDGAVVAGPANERVETGAVVRPVDPDVLDGEFTFAPERGLDPMPPGSDPSSHLGVH